MLTPEDRENYDLGRADGLLHLIGRHKVREYRASLYSHVIIAGADPELDGCAKYRVLG